MEPGGKLAARPGDHHAMPQASESARNRVIELATQPKRTFALVGATLHPVSGPAIPHGTLVVADGKIAAIGPAGTRVPPEAQTIELAGLDLWPGLVDAGTTVGLSEIDSLPVTQDFADASRFEPELRASTALKPDSEHIPVTRANGVLAAYVQPTGGFIAGQGCVVNLRGWVPRELVVADCAALDVTIPAFVPRSPEARRRIPGQGPAGAGADPQARRKEQLESIREHFRRGLKYGEIVDQARSRGAVPPPFDPRLAALVPYARGQKPVIFMANHRTEILDALAIARELKLKAVISGAEEAWKVAAELKEAGVPVIVAGTLNVPAHDHDPYDSAYANPARLHAAGVTFAIGSRRGGAANATNARNLPYEAATAVAFGLPEDVALRAVTLTPAQILGVGDRLGSLETGKRANLVVTAGHLLQPTTSVLALFIDGKHLTPESRHTQLYAKYLRRLEEVRSGTAPLGLDRPATTPARMPAHAAASPSPAAPRGARAQDPAAGWVSGRVRRGRPALGQGRRFLHRPGGRPARCPAMKRRHGPASQPGAKDFLQLPRVLGETDVLVHAHLEQGHRSIGPIRFVDHKDRRRPGQYRVRPQQAIHLTGGGHGILPVNHNQARPCTIEQVACLLHRARHDKPGSLHRTQLGPEEVQPVRIFCHRQDRHVDHAWHTPCVR